MRQRTGCDTFHLLSARQLVPFSADTDATLFLPLAPFLLLTTFSGESSLFFSVCSAQLLVYIDLDHFACTSRAGHFPLSISATLILICCRPKYNLHFVVGEEIELQF